MLLSVLHFAFCMGATKECLGKLFQKLNGFQDNINSLFGWGRKEYKFFHHIRCGQILAFGQSSLLNSFKSNKCSRKFSPDADYLVKQTL